MRGKKEAGINSYKQNECRRGKGVRGETKKRERETKRMLEKLREPEREQRKDKEWVKEILSLFKLSRLLLYKIEVFCVLVTGLKEALV